MPAVTFYYPPSVLLLTILTVTTLTYIGESSQLWQFDWFTVFCPDLQAQEENIQDILSETQTKSVYMLFKRPVLVRLTKIWDNQSRPHSKG